MITMTEVQQRYLSYTEAMEALNIKSPITFRKYIKAGLPTISVGKSKRVDRLDIDEFMSKHRYIKGKKVTKD